MNETKRLFMMIGIVVMLVTGVVLSLSVADRRATYSARARAEAVLIDSAHEQANTFTATLSARFQVLRSLAVSLALDGETDPAAIEAQLNQITSDAELSFFSVDLILPDGTKATASENYDINVADRDYFRQALSGQLAMEHVTARDLVLDCVVLAVPYYREGRVSGVLRGIYYENNLRQLLNSQAYGGSGYSYLICSNGHIIVNAEVDARLLAENNIFTALSQAEFRQEGALEQLQRDLQAGNSATLHYQLHGDSRLAVLVPLTSENLPPNDWYILNILSEDLLVGEIQANRRDWLESMFVFITFAGLALLLFILIERDYRRVKRREQEQIRQREEQFRIVTEQSGKYVIRYDIPTRTGFRGSMMEDGFGGTALCANAAEETVRLGYVDPISAQDYLDFFARIHAGESPVSADVLMRRNDGEQRWYRHDSTTIYDAEGLPRTAIISYYDNSDQRERELVYAKWQQELDSIVSEGNTALYEWNLTRDVCEAEQGKLAVDSSTLPSHSFDAWIAAILETRVFADDKPAFTAMLNREHLLAAYFSKKYRSSLSYRFLPDEGEPRWRQVSVQLVPYPDTQDIKAYLISCDIDEEKRREQDLLTRSQQDFLTGAINRETFISRVNEVLAQAPAATHAVMMLDIDGFKTVNDVLGHEAGDQVLREVVEQIHSVLRSSDIVGRIGGDEFMICLPETPFDAAIGKRAGQLCTALRRQLDNQVSISASVGVAVYPRDGLSFDQLYRCADTALYYAKNNGKDNYAFFQKGMTGDQEVNEIDQQDTASGLRRAVLVAGDDRTWEELSALLAPNFDALRFHEASRLSELLRSGRTVCAAIIDLDTIAGRGLANSACRQLIDNGVIPFALTSDHSDAAYIQAIDSDFEPPLYRPLNRQLLLLRLERLYALRDAERAKLQTIYRRLQTSEEARYREVLDATGTTVFIYDIATRSYQVDLLADASTSGSFEGHSLGAELLSKGIINQEDLGRICQDMALVERGEKQRISHTVLLATKDGSRRWFRIRMMKMENAEALTPKLLITVNDVHEWVEAEKALRDLVDQTGR